MSASRHPVESNVSIVVFVGPTISEVEGRRAAPALALDWRPPAAHGDLYLAARERPWGIGLIDGYFDRVGAVWHKEILWALSHGVHVFGAASLGALRAAECAMFGMVGVGEVFEAFAAGDLTDDDEVAVVHGPASSGYAKGSEAMVDLRWTLRAAVGQRIVSAETAAALGAFAKSLHYPERGYPLLLKKGARAGLPRPELDALAAWLPSGKVDQKQRDALALLAHIEAHRRDDPSPKRVRFTFQATAAWEAARRALETKRRERDVNASDPSSDLTSLEPDGSRARAERRALALEVATQHRIHLDDEARARAIATFLVARGLTEEALVERWLRERHLRRSDLERLACEQALIDRALAFVAPSLELSLADERALGGVDLGADLESGLS